MGILINDSISLLDELRSLEILNNESILSLKAEKKDIYDVSKELSNSKNLVSDLEKFFNIELKQEKNEICEEPKDKELGVESFKISSNNKPIYIIKSNNKVQYTISNFIKSIEDLREKINFHGDDLISEEKVSSNKEKLRIIIKSVNTNLNMAIKVSERELDINRILDDSLEETVENLKDAIIKIVDSRIIRSIIKPIRNGLNLGMNNIYSYLIEELNRFLIDLGISTKDIEINQPMSDYLDFINPLDTVDAKTNDRSLFEAIKEIYSYPYVFEDDIIVSEADVVLWRVE